jgi:hypothetical protein
MKSEEENKSEEPEAFYNRITKTTLGDLEERDRAYTRNLTFMERLAYLQKLIANVFGNDFSEQERKFKEGKITSRKQE